MATQPVTRLLLEWSAGNELALEQLKPLVYSELRKLAGSYTSREPTALVHEAYLRLVEQDQQTWESRSHFFGVAARLMRLILLDWARAVPLKGVSDRSSRQRPDEFIALDQALTGLGALDPRKARIVELRYFGGMTVEEIARCLSTSTATVEHEMRFAQLWLSREMKDHPTT
jgi:RNA polymerase sigma factor (TIGR02999 family)